jgi:hypothetical protein
MTSMFLFLTFISVRKLHALPFILCYEMNSVRVNLLISKDLFCNYYHIQCVCNHSTELVVIFVVVIFHFAKFLAHPKFYYAFKSEC